MAQRPVDGRRYGDHAVRTEHAVLGEPDSDVTRPSDFRGSLFQDVAMRGVKRRMHFLPGSPVKHSRHGLGVVIAQWGPVKVQAEAWQASNMYAHCLGIYDVKFT